MMEENVLPDCPVLDLTPPFPAEFEKLVAESTENFKKALPVMLRSFAEQQGWIEQYRAEIRRVILEVASKK